jgi:hypothetical protein
MTQESAAGGIKVRFGVLDASRYWEMAKHYKVTSYPWTKMFVPRASDTDAPSKDFDMTNADLEKQICDRKLVLEEQLGMRGTAATPGRSRIAPVLRDATSAWTFLHGNDAETSMGAKAAVVLLGRESADMAPTPICGHAPLPIKAPGWMTSTAMKFKTGRRKKVSFAYLPAPASAEVAQFFTVADDELPALLYVTEENFAQYTGPLETVGAPANAQRRRAVGKAVQLFVAQCYKGASKRIIALDDPMPGPARGAAGAMMVDLRVDGRTLEAECFRLPGRLCFLALVSGALDEGDDGPGPKSASQAAVALAALERLRTRIGGSKKYAEKIVLRWADVANEPEFAAAFGVDADSAGSPPALVSVKGGRRPRFVKSDLKAEQCAANGERDPSEIIAQAWIEWIDAVLAGDKRYTRFEEKRVPSLGGPES